MYKLAEDQYQLQLGEPFWMPEVGLGLGRYQGTVGDIPLELLGWFDKAGSRILTAEERILTAEEKANRLAARLRELGEDPESV